MVELITMSVYERIKKPIISLAPMEDITDTVFRQIVASVKRPDIFYTEFVNVEGLNSEGRDNIVHRLRYSDSEKPIIAQLWGINPDNFYKASKFVQKLGFDGIDINMGCSVKKIIQRRAGSGLINEERDVVKDIICSVKEGSNGLPVSIKTRLGWRDYDTEWIKFLLNQNLDVLTIHGRTAIGKNSISANWDMIKRCVVLRDRMSVKTLIFGNGDVASLRQTKEYSKRYCVDGVMVGRALISNPWFFSEQDKISQKERYRLFKKHLELFKNTWGSSKNFNFMKKFFRGYISDFDGANDLRQRFMACTEVEQALEIVERLLT